MKLSEYSRLGNYIEPCSERNRGLKVTLSQGICNNKYFQTPRQVSANSEADQVVRTGQFAYNKATTRNGDKISIAYREGEDCTVSAAYQLFKITNEEKLDPHYLWLWFRRSEFDRYARFKSHGSAHEFFTWEEMCNVILPIPPISEQRHIVSQFAAIDRRITNNTRMIESLEKTAQLIFNTSLYKYLSDEDVPSGLKKIKVSQICEYNTSNISSNSNFNCIEYLDTSSVTNNQFDEFQIIDLDSDDVPSRAKRLVKEGDIIISTVRPNLLHNGIIRGCKPNTVVSTGFIVLRSIEKSISNEVLYLWLTHQDTIKHFNEIAEMSTTTYPSISNEDILNTDIIVSDGSSGTDICQNIEVFFKEISLLHKENFQLNKLKSLILTQLA